MSSKRVKVRVEFGRKIFYERFLSTWREKSDDKNLRYVIFKAVHNLRQFPLEVEGINGLKQINGIGEMLAVRCEAAWEKICGDKDHSLSLAEVKQLKEDDYESLLCSASTAKQKYQAKRKLEMAVADKPRCSKEGEFDEKSTKVPRITKTASVPNSTVSSFHPLPKRAQTDPNEFLDSSDSDSDKVEADMRHKGSSSSLQNELATSSETVSREVRYLVCHPYQRPEVVLICDNREFHGSKKGKTVVEHLSKADIRFELRSLSVGDYLWVSRLIDGSEMVLDWVVERKTWDDLRQSIRKGRYEEQKQRLCTAPMQHRVYLVEGTGRGDVAAEQALATTMVKDSFLIQRCDNGRETARFLQSVTERLKRRVATQQLSGVCFEDLQELSKKARAETVRDTWVRQLMVCPGMSASRAGAIADAYPSMAALCDYFTTHPQIDELSVSVPQVPRAVLSQLRKFFQ